VWLQRRSLTGRVGEEAGAGGVLRADQPTEPIIIDIEKAAA
jgi:hypothetical protein